MLRVELSEKATNDWKNSINPNIFLENESVILEVRKFFENYDISSKDKKEELIKHLVETFASIMKVDYKLFIPQYPMDGSSGSYDRLSKTLTVYTKTSDNSFAFSPNVLTTILHELRHAYQDQYMMRENSELGEAIKYYTEHYSSPSTSNYVQELGYKTNLIETDAQRFSFAVASAIAERIVSDSQSEKNNRIKRKILEVKYNRIIAEMKSFERDFAKNYEIVSNMDDILSYLKEHFKSQINIFYATKFDSKEDELLQARLIASSFSELLNSKDLKNINNLSTKEMADIYLNVLSSVNPEDLVTKPNNDLTKLLMKLGNDFSGKVNLTKTIDGNLVFFKDYIEKLNETVEFGKVFLDKFNIEYDKNDNKDIYLKYAKNSFKYIATLLKNQTLNEFDELLIDNLSSMQTRDYKNFNRNKLIDVLQKSYSEKEIKTILMSHIDNNNDNYLFRSYNLNKGLLNGYALCYSAEKTKKMYSRFLEFKNIKLDSNNFDEILDTFNKIFPSFVSSCISKNELSKKEQGFILDLGIYLNNSEKLLQTIVESIKKSYSNAELKQYFEKSVLIQSIFSRYGIEDLNSLYSNSSEPSFQPSI